MTYIYLKKHPKTSVNSYYDATSISLGDAKAGGTTCIILWEGELPKGCLIRFSAFSLASVVACLIASL